MPETDILMDMSRLEKYLAFRFRDRSLLEEALRHSSFVNEQPQPDLQNNERLEFLGDAVLNLIIGHLLMDHYRDMPEGELSRLRANLVNERQLARVARGIHLGDFLRLGRGEEQSHGREKNSILADGLEAVIAAIYLDSGFDAAFRFVKSHFIDLVTSSKILRERLDFKSRLQELVQGAYKTTPEYRIVRESGPDHDKTFFVSIRVMQFSAEGEGKSKKLAEQDAARKMLEMLNGG